MNRYYYYGISSYMMRAKIDEEKLNKQLINNDVEKVNIRGVMMIKTKIKLH